MDHFELVSQYAPTGDQPQAIAELVKGFKEGNQFQTLLGVTGRQDLYNGQHYSGIKQAHSGVGPQQDIGSPALRRI